MNASRHKKRATRLRGGLMTPSGLRSFSSSSPPLNDLSPMCVFVGKKKSKSGAEEKLFSRLITFFFCFVSRSLHKNHVFCLRSLVARRTTLRGNPRSTQDNIQKITNKEWLIMTTAAGVYQRRIYGSHFSATAIHSPPLSSSSPTRVRI